MGLPQAQSQWISPEDYLAQEEASLLERSEYYDGEIVMMTGGTLGHNTIALNAAVKLRQMLAGSPCRVHINDVRLHVAAANCFFYPDVLVHCGSAAPGEKNLTEARLVIEVLSPSTASIDRGRKFRAYRQLESLIEYLIVDTEQQQIDVYRRAEGGDWLYHAYNAGEQVPLTGIDGSLAVADIYADSGVPEQPLLWLVSEPQTNEYRA